MIATTETLRAPLFTKRIRGEDVPTLGFGTYELEDETCSTSVKTALETGYRHIDTARVYGNEQEVGWGIRRSSVDRDQIFLTSKVWWEDLEPELLVSEIEKSLVELQVDYLDLALIHWPNKQIPLPQCLDTLHNLQEAEKIRHFGVSNFPPSLFEEAVKRSEVFCNQVEYHPLLDQEDLLQLARENDTALTAYSPLAQGNVMDEPELEQIADKHGKSPGQVALRWLIEQDNVLAIPRSSSPEHIEGNFDIFDFELDEADQRRIANLPKDRRQVDPDFAPDWEEKGDSS
ncbi:aldo/keto reductase [Pelagicoccus sp. SDUM812003]|uniref:aldo/keto reductase n=1 Tax=Pelagicoccus sp. SDUM812003 TaxID=3041267 RepID=UPI00280DB957|nr:aldo/keto reductase [Pelagicoccus sp. SDUM812003]MDQ8201793.1 aldo/keto reductase [Pelagicoccus sp. SDUM812003]